MTNTPAAPPIRIAPPPPGWNARQIGGGLDADKKANQSLGFGIASFVFDPLFLPTIIAIVYGVKSLRAGTTHRNRAIAGLTLGIVGGVIAILSVTIAISTILLAHHGAVSGASLESRITTGMANQGVVLSDVRCPTLDAAAKGSKVTCTAQQSGQGAVRIEVVFSDSAGAFSAQVSRA